MMYRFSSYVLALLLLVVSGQVMAANYYSKIATPALAAINPAEWVTEDCNTAAATSPAAGVALATDNYFLCGTANGTRVVATGVVLAAGTPSVITGTITIGDSTAAAGPAGITLPNNITLAGNLTVLKGTLNIAGTTLTMPAGSTLTNTATTGTITVGAAGIIAFAGAGTFANSTGIFTPTAGATVSFAGAGTISGTVPLSNLTVTVGALTLSANTTIVKDLVITTPGTVALAATNTVAGNVTTYGTALTGTLKFTGAPHTITATAAATIPVLDASAFTANVVTGAGGFDITIGTLVVPAAGGAANNVTLTSGAAANRFIVSAAPAGGAVCLNNAVAAVYPNAIVASATNFVCTPPAVAPIAAPVLSTKEKPAVFSEEVKH